jgi:hypothetical protein
MRLLTGNLHHQSISDMREIDQSAASLLSIGANSTTLPIIVPKPQQMSGISSGR